MTKEINPLALTEKENLLLSAGVCIATIASGTPTVFDTIQLSTIPEQFVRKYAEAALLLTDNKGEWEELVIKLSKLSESLPCHHHNMTDDMREDLIKCLLNIQLYLPWKTHRLECESMNNSILGIYNILDMVHHNSNYPCPNDPSDIRKQVLNKLRGFYSSLSPDQECPSVCEMNSDECQSYEGNCNICILEHAIKAISGDDE